MKNKKVAALVAMVLILICFVPVLALLLNKRDGDYEVICFGDSVMAGYYGAGTIPDYVEKRSGRKTLNAAFGGLPMSELNGYPKAGDAAGMFSMVELSKALVNKDFSLQIMATKSQIEAFPSAWVNTAERLNTLDYSAVKFVLIEQGVNDYLLGKPLDDESDRYNEYTFAGALRVSIENVRKALPDATIVLVTPLFMQTEGMEDDCTVTDFGGGTLPEYVAKEKEVAAEYGLTCVDNFYGSGITRENFKTYLYDGLHTLEEANQLIVDNIVKNVEGLCK